MWQTPLLMLCASHVAFSSIHLPLLLGVSLVQMDPGYGILQWFAYGFTKFSSFFL